MSIFSMFQTKPAETAPAPATPGNMPAPGTPTAATATPGNGVVPMEPPKPESPLDIFSGAWDTDVTKLDAPPDVSLNADPKLLMEAAKNLDFSKFISQEDLAAIQQGGQGAMEAMLRAQTAQSQAVYAQNAAATAKIVEAALAKQARQFETFMSSIMSRDKAQEALVSGMPELSHPAVMPVASAIQDKLRAKYPGASATEVSNMTQQFFKALAETVNKGQPGAKNKAEDDFDWSTFL